MELFTLNLSNKSTVSINEPAVMRIPAFKRLINRDRGSVGDADGRKKYKALKELTFIWYYCDFKSPLADRGDKERWVESLKIAELEDADIDGDVNSGIDAYKKLTDVISLRLYRAALEGCNKLEQHFNTIDFEERDEMGRAYHSPQSFLKNIKELKTTFENLREFRDMVKQDLAGKTKMRGNSLKGNREDPN